MAVGFETLTPCLGTYEFETIAGLGLASSSILGCILLESPWDFVHLHWLTHCKHLAVRAMVMTTAGAYRNTPSTVRAITTFATDPELPPHYKNYSNRQFQYNCNEKYRKSEWV